LYLFGTLYKIFIICVNPSFVKWLLFENKDALIEAIEIWFCFQKNHCIFFKNNISIFLNTTLPLYFKVIKLLFLFKYKYIK
jgi:hypothetical protein